ncbi:hypothetical protein ACU686_23800 [Yinghuangia aomiensis]
MLVGLALIGVAFTYPLLRARPRPRRRRHHVGGPRPPAAPPAALWR